MKVTVKFDKNSTQYSSDKDYSLIFVKSTWEYFNSILQAKGHVFLNEMYDHLGLPRTQMGQFYGWRRDRDHTCKVNILYFETITLEFEVSDIIELLDGGGGEPKPLTYGDLMRYFGEQFPGLLSSDIRPNGSNQLYIWVKDAPTNIIATYSPEKGTFTVETTREEWSPLSRRCRHGRT